MDAATSPPALASHRSSPGMVARCHRLVGVQPMLPGYVVHRKVVNTYDTRVLSDGSYNGHKGGRMSRQLSNGQLQSRRPHVSALQLSRSRPFLFKRYLSD